MRRYFVTLYRGRRLYSVALLLLLCATALGTYVRARTSNEYQVTSRIWISGAIPVAGSTSSPAQQLTDTLDQLLKSDSIVAAVLQRARADRTSMRDWDGRDIIQVRRMLTYKAEGPNTVTLTFSGPDPVMGQLIVQSTLDQLEEWNLDFPRELARTRVQDSQVQLIVFRDQMNDSGRKLDEYNAQYPVNIESPPEQRERQRLQGEYEVARDLYLEKLRETATIPNSTKQLDIRVLDQPIVPQSPSPPSQQLSYLLLGVASSFGLVLSIVIFTTWQDRTIRTVDDLRRLSNAPLLAVVPHLSSSVGKDAVEKGAAVESPTLGRLKGAAPVAGRPSSGGPHHVGDRD